MARKLVTHRNDHVVCLGRGFSLSPLHQPSGGFSLVEVVIAIGLFAIVLLGGAALLKTTIQANVANRNLATATFLGQDKVEYLKAVPFSHPDLVEIFHADLNNPMDANGDVGGVFVREWTVSGSNPDLDGINQLKTITVTVSWSWPEPLDHAVNFTLVKDDQ
tara:strand:+ start:2521 stop:3006 length:486 start_codon:yes stop_codon:yes gene_type:complete